MATPEPAHAVATWLATWFERRGRHVARAGDDLADVDYLDAGLLDSVALIELIMDIEAEFRIRLTADAMKDPRFSKLSGLVSIIRDTTGART